MGSPTQKAPNAWNLFADPGVTVASTSQWRERRGPKSAIQATVTGTGAVTAGVTIQFSADGVNPLSTAAGTITLSGTTTAADGFQSDADWPYMRAVVDSVAGTGATVQVVMNQTVTP